MKTKKIEKKLNLKKDTIANLSSKMMQDVMGGDVLSQFRTLCLTNCYNCGTYTCDTCLIECTYTTSIPDLHC